MTVKIPPALHDWSVTPKEAVDIQRALAARVVAEGSVSDLRVAAGADLAFSKDKQTCVAGVVAWDVQRREVIEQHVVRRPVMFPYVPGLLSFREAPALLGALGELTCEPDVFLFDGQGLAHPRRFGLACHVGLLLDRPSLGCAKSLLVGTCDTPGEQRGSTTPLLHHDERVGMAVRTRDRVKPVYVSVGHRLSVESAVEVVLACSIGYRLPEPTRLADKLVGRERAGA